MKIFLFPESSVSFPQTKVSGRLTSVVNAEIKPISETVPPIVDDIMNNEIRVPDAAIAAENGKKA